MPPFHLDLHFSEGWSADALSAEVASIRPGQAIAVNVILADAALDTGPVASAISRVRLGSCAFKGDRLITIELSRARGRNTECDYEMKTWKPESVLMVSTAG